MGFVTLDRSDTPLVNVFLPTTPNPTSGYMLLVPRDELRELPIPVEEAIKVIVSGGSIMDEEQGHAIAVNAAALNPAAPGLARLVPSSEGKDLAK